VFNFSVWSKLSQLESKCDFTFGLEGAVPSSEGTPSLVGKAWS
jgi:hypothetical protein